MNKILTDLIRKARFEGWERGKQQKDTPTKYTLSDEAYPKEIFAEAKTALQEYFLQLIGSDEPNPKLKGCCDNEGGLMCWQETKVKGRNQLREELRGKLK